MQQQLIKKCVLVSTLMLGSTSMVQAADTLSVVTFGGAFENAVKQAYFQPYGKEHGTTFTYESYDGGLAKLEAMEQSQNPTWDLMDMETNDVVQACQEGLLEPLDKSSLGDTSDFLPGAVNECGIASMVWSTVFAYDSSKLKQGPTTLEDFFDIKKFPGKRGMRKNPKVAMEWGLLADGVPRDQVYKVLATKEGQDRAFKKLDSIKSDIVWWDAGAQPAQLLADGAVVMTQGYNGRIQDAITQEHKPFKIVWDDQLYDYEWWAVPAGAKNADEAKRFIAYASRMDVIAKLSRYIPYAPPRKSAMDNVDAAQKPNLPTAPENFTHAVQIDNAFWVDNFDSINARFQSWLNQK